MKKLTFLFILLFIPTLCFGAVSALVTWEFNASASANMVGGGGFKTGATGTDFSRYTTAAAIEAAYPALGKFSGTDLAIDDGDANPGVISSATHNFVATDVGNVIHIYAVTGVTAGWYEIVSCASNKATLDRAAGTTDGAKSGITWYLGGALSLNSTLDSDFFSGSSWIVAGQKFYFLKGAYTLGEAAGGVNGTSSKPIMMIGYTGTRDTACNGLDRPSIACGTNQFVTGQYWWLRNFIITSTSASSSGALKGGYCSIILNNKIINSNPAANGICIGDASSWLSIINNELICYYGYGIKSANGSHLIMGNYIHHCTYGISSQGDNIFNNVISNNVTAGIILSYAPSKIVGNTIYGSENKIGIGISLVTYYGDIIENNIIYGLVTGISATAADATTYIDYNDIYNCTTPVSNVTELGNDISVDPGFTNAAGTLIEDCEDVWVIGCDADENTITTDNSVYKVGTYSVKNAVQAAADAGDIIATEVLSSTNMTAYDGFGVWMRTSDANFAAGDWQLLFDDTAGCTSPILTYNIPAMSANTWYWFYFEGGTSLASATAIISVGLKQVNDEGAIDFYIDDVRATNNDFTFSSSAGGGVGTGFPQSMPGATGDYQWNIGVDQDDNTAAGGGSGGAGFFTMGD